MIHSNKAIFRREIGIITKENVKYFIITHYITTCFTQGDFKRFNQTVILNSLMLLCNEDV